MTTNFVGLFIFPENIVRNVFIVNVILKSFYGNDVVIIWHIMPINDDKINHNNK